MDPDGSGVRRSEVSKEIAQEEAGSVAEGHSRNPVAGTAILGDMKSEEEVGGVPEVLEEGRGAAVEFEYPKAAEHIGGMPDVAEEDRGDPTAAVAFGDTKARKEIGRSAGNSKEDIRIPDLAEEYRSWSSEDAGSVEEGHSSPTAAKFGDVKSAEEFGGMPEVLEEYRGAAVELEYPKAMEQIGGMPDVSKEDRGDPIPGVAPEFGYPKAARRINLRWDTTRRVSKRKRSGEVSSGRELQAQKISISESNRNNDIVFATNPFLPTLFSDERGLPTSSRWWRLRGTIRAAGKLVCLYKRIWLSTRINYKKAIEFLRINRATVLLLRILSSPLFSSSDIGNLKEHLKHIKLLFNDVEIEVLRNDSIQPLLKELNDLITELEDLVDEYRHRLLRIQVEYRSSATEASHVKMQMDKNEEMVKFQNLISCDFLGRIRMISDKVNKASVILKSFAKPPKIYLSSSIKKNSTAYKLLRADVSEQATISKALLKLKGAEKDEAGDAPVVSFENEGSFDKDVEISSSISSCITLNRAEKTNNKMLKDWEVDSHSNEDRKRIFGGCISDLPPNIQICGRANDKENVVNLLLSDMRSNLLPNEHRQGTKKFSVIQILGMAGVGKTTLAKLVYYDPGVFEHFDARGWLDVPDDTTDLSLSKAIASSIMGRSSYGNDPNHLRAILHEELSGKRLLLVLDDVRTHNSFPWESMLALLSSAMLGKIIITSRAKLVDMRASSKKKLVDMIVYRLDRLPLEKSWDLFTQCAFYGQNPDPRDKIIEIGMMILCKCNNLPSAVKTLGSLLNFRFDMKIWADVLESEIWETEKLPALVLSYTLLPSHLKSCFLYCSTFPRGHKFDKYELVRLWMAQDYIEPKGNKRMEDIGCEYFFELQRMSFFEKSWDKTFTMNTSLYELSQYITENQSCAIEDSNRHIEYARHLYVAGGYESKNSLSIVKSFAVKSLLYQLSDGKIPENILNFSRMKCLRTFQLKYHEDFTLKEATHATDSSSLYFGKLIHLRYLQICDTSIKGLPKSICELYHLQTLVLENCSNLRELPSEIGNLLNLRHLGLSNVNIKMLPESVCQLSNLQSLIMDYCKSLCELPTHIGNLILLQDLGLSGTNITTLPESICYLKMKILKLDNCKDFVELPSNIGDLVNLEEIEVSGARIERLPSSVCGLFNLLKLDMAGSDLQELPSGIGNLLKLNYLGLSHTNIDVLPESLCQLLNLHTLKLNGCTNLSHLPSGIGALTRLHHLILSDTDITVLPESLRQLSNLQTLELDGCRRCHSLPGDVGDLINLGHLELSDTDISELPTSFCRLSNLVTLELNGCYRLAQLPDNIGDLSNLHELEITETEIRELPKSLCQLAKLRKLKLNGNKNLEEFPTGIENLNNLTHLELVEVGIKKLPEQISKLTKLVKLSFERKEKPTVGFSKHKHYR